MKIKELRLKNYVKFEDFELVFNDGVTHLIGMNGAGKTTVGLTAIWAGFKGIAEKSTSGQLVGERWRFIQEGKKSLDIEITLCDEMSGREITLKRHITKTTNTIKITSSDNADLSRDYIESLFNVAFLSASHFSGLTGKEQADAMGIDVGMFDATLRQLKNDAQDYRREIKKLGEMPKVEKVDRVDVAELQKEWEWMETANQKKLEIERNRKICNDEMARIKKQKEEETRRYEGRLKALKMEYEATKLASDRLPPAQELIDTGSIKKKIQSATAINEKAFEYNRYIQALDSKKGFEDCLSRNKAEQEKIISERTEYLQSKTFGIKGLQIDEDGNLTKDGKLIRQPYFSKGELEVLVARIAMNLNPELKVRFIDNFEVLDDKNQLLLINNLTKKGFQIITAQVGSKAIGDNSVLLRDCRLDVLPGTKAESVNSGNGGAVDQFDHVGQVEQDEDYY